MEYSCGEINSTSAVNEAAYGAEPQHWVLGMEQPGLQLPDGFRQNRDSLMICLAKTSASSGVH